MKINLHTWFSDRELNYCPKHFIKCTTPLTDEGKLWVYENLIGRFYVNNGIGDDWGFDSTISFEDPQEAMIYELTWS